MVKNLKDDYNIQKIEKYKTEDGEIFDTYKEAKEHVEQIKSIDWYARSKAQQKEIEELKRQIALLEADINLMKSSSPTTVFPPIVSPISVPPYDPNDPRNKAWYFGTKGDTYGTITKDEYDKLSEDEKKYFTKLSIPSAKF